MVTARLDDSREALNRLPTAEAELLARRLAAVHLTTPDRMVVGPGSSAILRGCVALSSGPDAEVIMAEPGFEAIGQYAHALGMKVHGVALDRRYRHDLAAMRRAITARTRIIYICNPNNPTGTSTARSEIDSLLSQVPANVRIIIDEAYHPYANARTRDGSFIARPANHPGVIVTRTFSNAYGLAGARIGYAYASPEVAADISALGLSQDIAVQTFRAANAALDDPQYVAAIAEKNRDARQEFMNQALTRGLKPIDSEANFVLLYIDDCLEVAEHFRRHGIMVAANFSGLAQSIRVTLGSAEEMKQFWRVLDRKATLAPI